MSNEIAKTKEELVNETKEAKEEILKKAADDFMSDKENLKRIFTATDSEEMKEAFRSVGLEVTDEQLEVFKKTFADSMNAEINNLPAEERQKLIEKASESELEKISGGAYEHTKKGFGNGMKYGVVGGAIAGALVGTADLVVNLSLDICDDNFGADSVMDRMWHITKRSFKRGVATMAAVSSTAAGISAAAGLAEDLHGPFGSSSKPSSKSTPASTGGSPSTVDLLA